MDPVSRRHIWMFLQELKRQGKTIIFTTQDLEEAEAVVDRAGILVQGEMLIQGSSEYLKQTLGCGYSLEIRLAEEKSPFEQKIMVRKQIRDSNCKFKEVESSCEYVLKLTLPLNQEEHFSAIFSWL
jgi:ATP-binding cassette, subfamily A (ABC1), member 3